MRTRGWLLIFGILSIAFWGCESLLESDTTPPVVSIQSPLSGIVVSDLVEIRVSTSDNENIKKVEFYIDDSLHHSDQDAPYIYNWNTASVSNNSQHTIRVISYDTSDNSTESQPIQVTIDNTDSYPAPVHIININYTLSELNITWEKSQISDFYNYQIFHSSSSGGSKELLGIVDNRMDTTHTITEFDPTHEMWYWILVSDSLGLSTLGSGYMVIELPPTISLIESIDFNDTVFRIRWTKSDDVDFHSYALFESSTEDMSGKTQIFSSNGSEDTQYTVEGIVGSEYRYYQVVVQDLWNLESISPIKIGSSYPKITFSSDREGNQDIYIIDINGNGVTNLSNSPEDDSRPVFSHNGSRIAFRAERDGNREIYGMNSDGSNQINLSNNSDRDENPEFSPDGSKLVFTSYRDGNNEVYIMNSDGSGQTNLSNYVGYDDDPHFSPNGYSILFYRTGDLYMMDIDGGNQRLLSANSYGGKFSPDGLKIIFSKSEGIFLMDINSGGHVEIASGTGLSNPEISPNGMMVLYTQGASDIYLMNIDGSNRSNLTHNSSYDFLPNFSSTSSLITFSSDRDGNQEIYLMNADGTAQVNVTNHSSSDKFPKFQPL